MKSCRVLWRIDADFPPAQGHFPGHPIVPGAAMLAQVLSVLEMEFGVKPPALGVPSAKFLNSAKPGDVVTIEVSEAPDDAYVFKCSAASGVLVMGSMQCRLPAA